jgi:hypothetical protein
MRTALVSSLVAILVLVPCAGCKKEKQEAGVIRVNAVVGSVCINARGNDARVGALLAPGDRIITGTNSMVIIQIPERSGIKIYENTDFLIAAAEIDKDGTATDARFNLDGGRAFLTIEKLAKSRTITVTSPTAVASVRGTSFMVAVNGASDGKKEATTGVSVVDGTVVVTAKNAPKETRAVMKGSMVVMAGSRIAEETKKISAADLRDLEAQESEINRSVKREPDAGAEEAIKEKAAQSAPPVLKSEQAIKEYYHKLEEVNLDDGSTLVGAVIYQDSRIARIHTTAGVVQVPTGSIVNIRIR